MQNNNISHIWLGLFIASNERPTLHNYYNSNNDQHLTDEGEMINGTKKTLGLQHEMNRITVGINLFICINNVLGN